MIFAHPGLPEFDYIKPESLSEASRFLSEHNGEARPLLGGTDIFVRMRDGVWKDKYLVDVKVLEGMRDISFDPSTGLTIGAAVSMNAVIASLHIQEHYPLLAKAARSVASYQLRTRATIVGNICNASPAGDTIGACMLLDGNLIVQNRDGSRAEPLNTLIAGPGQTVLEAGDIVTAIHFPIPPEGGAGTYLKLGRNNASDLAIVGVTALGYPDPSSFSGFGYKLVLASVAPVPLVVEEVGKIMAVGNGTEKSIAEAAQAAMDACSPIDDVRGGALYRKIMVRNLSQKALNEVWGELHN